MHCLSRIAAIAVLAFGTITGPALAAAPAAHDHGTATGTTKLQLDQGKKWATDAPLRQGMVAIRDAVRGAPAPLHKGTASPTEYAALGNRIEAEVGRIVKECKLPPAADAQLHLVIADVIAGADAMKGAKDGKAGRAGLVKVNGAVESYARYFDHPGWSDTKR